MSDEPRPLTPTRNWPLIILGGIAVLLVAGALTLYLLFSWVHDSTVDRFAKVEDGMTLKTVISIMGREPTFDQLEPNGSLIYGWVYQETTAAVVVHTRDGVTIRKQPFKDVGPPVRPDTSAPWRHNIRQK